MSIEVAWRAVLLGMMASATIGVASDTADQSNDALVAATERGSNRLEAWCNRTLLTQPSRIAALEQLLTAAQASSVTNPSAAPAAALGELGERLETRRIRAEVDSSTRERKLEVARRDLEDLSRQIDVLQKTLAKLSTKGNGTAALQQVLRAAEAAKASQEKQLQLLQVPAKQDSDFRDLDIEYQAKQAAFAQIQHQTFTSARSLEVLTSALEDEAAYLAEVRSICGMATIVSRRLRDELLKLSSATEGVLASPTAPVLPAVASPTKASRGPAGTSQATAPVPPTSPMLAVRNSSVGPAATSQPAAPVPPTLPAPAAQNLSVGPVATSQSAAPVPPTLPAPAARTSAIAVKVSTTSLPALISDLPPAYAAWRPDGAANTVRRKRPAAVDEDSAAAGSPTSRMMAMLGEDDTSATKTSKPSSPAVGTKTGPTSAATAPKRANTKRGEDSAVSHVAVTTSIAAPLPAAASPDSADSSNSDSDDSVFAVSHIAVTTSIVAPLPAAAPSDSAGEDSVSAVSQLAVTTSMVPTLPAKAPSDSKGGSVVRARSTAKTSLPGGDHGSVDATLGGFDVDDAVDLAFPAPGDEETHQSSAAAAAASPPQHPRTESAAKQNLASSHPAARHTGGGALVQEEAAAKVARHEVAHSTRRHEQPGPPLPGQYAAWTPSDEGKAVEKDPAIEKMVADFSEDDDEDSKPVVKTRHHRRSAAKKRHSSVTQTPPESRTTFKEDGVVYDDDDLPLKKRRRLPLAAELQGGWKSLMRQKAAKPRKIDPDVAIMESLYTGSGGLPAQYAAWKPPSSDASRATSAQPPSAASHTAMVQDDDSSSGTGPGADDDSDDSGEAPALVQVSSSTATRALRVRGQLRGTATSPAAAAAALLSEYAKALQSPALENLGKKPLTGADLSQSLQDSSNSPRLGVAVAHSGQSNSSQARAERWCSYFQEHVSSAKSLQRVVRQAENASEAVAEADAKDAAIREEVDARAQLEKTVEQDVRGLADLLATEQDLVNASIAMNFTMAARVLEDAHLELADALEAAWRQRSKVVEVQRAKLAKLKQDAKEAESELSTRKKAASKAQAQLSDSQNKLRGIRSSCASTLLALDHRERAASAEVNAIKQVLQVLNVQ